ncbi:MAG: helix-turn-helix domain-containing protein [Patescibacteria group bacterium]
MSTFSKKIIAPRDRVCLRLKRVRLEKNMSLEEIADKTKINIAYLSALENCQFDAIPHQSLYQKNFLKKYLSAIGVDSEEYLSQFRAEEMKATDTVAPKRFTRYTARYHLSSLPNILRYVFTGAFTACLLLYLGLQVKNVLQPPSLVLTSPTDGMIAKKNYINIAGASDPEVKVSINGQSIMSDESGNFNQAISLTPGINTISVLAQKKHGKTTEEVRHIIYKETQEFSLSRDKPNRLTE